MLDYQAIIKSDTATRLLNVFTFEYNKNINRLTGYGESTIRKLKSDMRKKSLSEILTIRGGGRKAKSADVEKEILDEIEKGNYHTRQQIADMIKDKFNITVTVTAVSRLLKKMDSKN